MSQDPLLGRYHNILSLNPAIVVDLLVVFNPLLS